MLWLWVLLGALLLTVLLCRTRVGVWAAYDREGTLRLAIQAGPLRTQLLPAKEKRKKPQKDRKPKQKTVSEKKKELPEKKKVSVMPEDVRDALRTLPPALGKLLRRTRRGVRIKPLRVSLTLGGQEDPAGTARLYGELHAAMWGWMPLLERLVDIRNPEIHIGVDFQSSVLAVEGEAGVTFRIGTLMAAGFGLAVPALKWLLRCRKRHKAPKLEKNTEGPAA